MARFCERFGWEAYWGTGTGRERRYPTTDGIIPWRLFYLMSELQRHLLAMERLNQASATLHALAVAFGDEGKAKAMMRKLEREALPTIPVKRKGAE